MLQIRNWGFVPSACPDPACSSLTKHGVKRERPWMAVWHCPVPPLQKQTMKCDPVMWRPVLHHLQQVPAIPQHRLIFPPTRWSRTTVPHEKPRFPSPTSMSRRQLNTKPSQYPRHWEHGGNYIWHISPGWTVWPSLEEERNTQHQSLRKILETSLLPL